MADGDGGAGPGLVITMPVISTGYLSIPVGNQRLLHFGQGWMRVFHTSGSLNMHFALNLCLAVEANPDPPPKPYSSGKLSLS